jgi:hypothetical protein
MIVGIVVVVAVTFSQRGGSKLIGKRYFSDEIGWSVIPTLGLLSGLAFLLFFGKREWYAPYQAILVGVVVIGALAVRAVLESRANSSSRV